MATINLSFPVYMHCSPLRGGVCSSIRLKLSWLVTSLTKSDTMFYLLPLKELEVPASFCGGGWYLLWKEAAIGKKSNTPHPPCCGEAQAT